MILLNHLDCVLNRFNCYTIRAIVSKTQHITFRTELNTKGFSSNRETWETKLKLKLSKKKKINKILDT